MDSRCVMKISEVKLLVLQTSISGISTDLEMLVPVASIPVSACVLIAFLHRRSRC